MNTTENNKIIAEFLGAIPNKGGEYEMYGIIPSIEDELSEKHFFFGSEMPFTTNWNWLMEVVEKIQNVPSYDKDKFGTIVKIEGRNCSIKSDNYGSKNKEYSKKIYFNANYSGDTKIQAVYDACVDFIKWYNLKNS